MIFCTLTNVWVWTEGVSSNCFANGMFLFSKCNKLESGRILHCFANDIFTEHECYFQMHGGATYAIQKVLIFQKNLFQCRHCISNSTMGLKWWFGVKPPPGLELLIFWSLELHSSTVLAGFSWEWMLIYQTLSHWLFCKCYFSESKNKFKYFEKPYQLFCK